MGSAPRSIKKPLLVGVLVTFTLLLGCCGSCAAMLALKGRSMREDEGARFAPLSGVCRGAPAPSAAAFVPGSEARAQAYDAGGLILLYSVPTLRRSASTADTSAVVCEGTVDRVLVQRCDYETGIVTGVTGGHNTVQRWGYHRVVRVVAARTGVELARHDFDGAPPDACPDSEHFGTGGQTRDLYGSAPDHAPVETWVEHVLATGTP